MPARRRSSPAPSWGRRSRRRLLQRRSSRQRSWPVRSSLRRPWWPVWRSSPQRRSSPQISNPSRTQRACRVQRERWCCGAGGGWSCPFVRAKCRRGLQAIPDGGSLVLMAMEDVADDVLIAGLAAGDAAAARIFVDRFSPRAVGQAYQFLGDRAAAEDVAQEALLRAWRHAGSFDARRRLGQRLAVDDRAQPGDRCPADASCPAVRSAEPADRSLGRRRAGRRGRGRAARRRRSSARCPGHVAARPSGVRW